VNRRDLVRAVAAGLLWPQGTGRRRQRREPPPWTFRLDRNHRWTLAARDGRAVVAGAEITFRLSDGEDTPLSALHEARHFRLAGPHGEDSGWQVVGTLAGVELSAQLLDGPPPVVTVTARGLEDERYLDEVRFFDTRAARIPALEGRPSAWINGYQSSDLCRLVALDHTVEETSHWQLAVLGPGGRPGAPRGLALAFGTEDAGEGRFAIAAGRVVAASRLGGRPVGVALPPAALSLAIVPAADPLADLGRLAGAGPKPAAPRDEVPTGWCSWHELRGSVTETDVLANLEDARARFGSRDFRMIQLDQGYQRAAGDWDTNTKFPHGHRWLTEQIHAAGFQTGLWLAPFAVADGSGIPTAHPEWLLETPQQEPLVLAEQSDWGGKVYGLDAAQAAVTDFLRDLARHAVSEWGYDYLKLDLLHFGSAGTRRNRRMSPAESYRTGLRALREGAGRAFVLGCRAPLQHTSGLVDAMRIGPDTYASFDDLQPAARAVALRSHFNGAAWLNDPDCLVVREPLTLDEARSWATMVALCGGVTLASDVLGRLPAGRVELLQRAMPVAPVRSRVFDLAVETRDGDPPPAWLLAQVRDDWWMLAIVNWRDTPRRFALSLAAHGVRGPLASYDVWADRRRGDVDGSLALRVEPHASVVLSLRRRRRAPFVLGSSRHVVQGAVDLADERWDERRKVLAGRSVRLDGRPYAVTIAVPAGLRPRRARSTPERQVTIEPRPNGSARLLFPEPPGEEIAWEVEF
jgi:hypothetical protein